MSFTCAFAAFLAFPSVVASAISAVPSAGCGHALPSDLTLGGSTFRDVEITDPDARLGVHYRQYKVSVPSGYDASRPIPLMFYFHGQDGSDKTEDDKFVELSNTESFVVVSPKGMADGAKRYGECAGTSTAWNVGSAGRLDVCTRECQPAIHLSCLHTANVSNCNWATCYDDFHYFRKVLAAIKSQICVDVSRVYATGVSNGGMFLYALTQELPKGTFAAIVPWYGAYLQHMQHTPPQGTPIFHLHGSLDKTIPATGTYASQYYYTPLNETLHGFATGNGCDLKAPLVRFPTQWDDRAKAFQHRCMAFQGCHSSPVVRCLFPKQAHGFWPNFGEKLTWSFMKNFTSSHVAVDTLDAAPDNELVLL